LSEFYNEGFFHQELIDSAAEGLQHNQGLTTLGIEVSFEHADEERTVAVDPSPLIHASLGRIQDLDLSFTLDDCVVPGATLASLAGLLENEFCTLQCLNIQLSSCEHEPVASLIGSIKQCNSLTKATISTTLRDASGEAIQEFAIFSQLHASALGSTKPNLKSLTLCLGELCLDSDTKDQLQHNVLACMEANTQLEYADLVSMSVPNLRRMYTYFNRNKIGNQVCQTCVSLDNGTTAPVDLGPILADIESCCGRYGIPTDLPFLNIWFWLIKSRPLEAAKYCP
jgi:hypothetical protein